MKQMAFMMVSVILGTAGSFALSPIYGLAVYYLYAVIRPQFIWEWNEFAGIMTVCVFAWEDRARESSTFMLEEIRRRTAAWARPG